MKDAPTKVKNANCSERGRRPRDRGKNRRAFHKNKTRPTPGVQNGKKSKKRKKKKGE